MSNKYQCDILIIGGGLAGLAAAIELLDHDKKVIILERDKKEKFGGLAKESSCTVLGKFKPEGMAAACRASYFEINGNADINEVIPKSLEIACKGTPVIVDVNIDYSKPTRFTQGVVKTVLKRFPPGDKTRFIGRALLRKITG